MGGLNISLPFFYISVQHMINGGVNMVEHKYVHVKVYADQISKLRKLIPDSESYSDAEIARRALDIAIEKLRTEHESKIEEIKEMLREILERIRRIENAINRDF